MSSNIRRLCFSQAEDGIRYYCVTGVETCALPIRSEEHMFFFFSSRRRHTRSLCDWSSDVCSSDLIHFAPCGRQPKRVEGKAAAGDFQGFKAGTARSSFVVTIAPNLERLTQSPQRGEQPGAVRTRSTALP